MKYNCLQKVKNFMRKQDIHSEFKSLTFFLDLTQTSLSLKLPVSYLGCGYVPDTIEPILYACLLMAGCRINHPHSEKWFQLWKHTLMAKLTGHHKNSSDLCFKWSCRLYDWNEEPKLSRELVFYWQLSIFIRTILLRNTFLMNTFEMPCNRGANISQK